MVTAWYRVPLRRVSTIDAPVEAARQALRQPQTWIRAATAAGGLFQISTQTSTLEPEQLVRFRPRGFGRSFLLQVEAGDLPVLCPVEGSVRTWIRIVPAVVASGDGCSVSVRLEWLGPTRALDPTLRPALVRFAELLLGIVILVAREPVRVVAGAIIDGGRVLVARRVGAASDGAGRWEFPGGKVQPGESEEQALQRELLEEVGLRALIRDRVGPMVLVRPGVQLRCYRADRVGEDELVLTAHDEVRWVDAAELARLDLLDADRLLLEPVRAALDVRS